MHIFINNTYIYTYTCTHTYTRTLKSVTSLAPNCFARACRLSPNQLPMRNILTKPANKLSSK